MAFIKRNFRGTKEAILSKICADQLFLEVGFSKTVNEANNRLDGRKMKFFNDFLTGIFNLFYTYYSL